MNPEQIETIQDKLDAKDVCRTLKITNKSLQRMVRENRFPKPDYVYIKSRHRRIWCAQVVKNWIQEFKNQ